MNIWLIRVQIGNDFEGLTFRFRICKLSIIMSAKLLKLRWRLFFWTATGKIKKIHKRLTLNSIQSKMDNILIVFPMDEKSFRVALYAFRELGQRDSRQRNYKFLIREQFKDLFHIQIGMPILVRNSEFENILSDERMILDQIDNTRFDIIIDLNSNFHLGISRLISMLKSDVKVGFSTPFSDQFYNIQLDVSKSGIMERGYKQINMMLAP